MWRYLAKRTAIGIALVLMASAILFFAGELLPGDFATKLLGSQATPDAIASAIASDPQTALKAMIAEQDFQLKQRELDIKELQTTLADVQSARQRETSVKDSVNKVLAYAVVGGFLALVAATLLGAAKVESVLAGTLVGYLSAKCEQVLAYYFGSSRGSDKKTDLLAKATPVKE
ncbi:MAG: hypothetical protein LLF76_00715 [Planctomycetaceae bacterium]|nr:hypothetical protein [Planctomycetaceae bacterium]